MAPWPVPSYVKQKHETQFPSKFTSTVWPQTPQRRATYAAFSSHYCIALSNEVDMSKLASLDQLRFDLVMAVLRIVISILDLEICLT